MKFKIVTRKSYDRKGLRSIEPIECNIKISEPTGDKQINLTKEDVWGIPPMGENHKSTKGMKVATYNQVCPIWKDVLPYKSTTFVCPKDKENEVIYWIEFVYGCNCISKRQELDDLRVALRADYQCW